MWSKMWPQILAVLCFFRITDESNRLSLTNIALAIVLWRICFAATIDMAELISLAVTLGGYQGKRLMSRWPAAAETLQDELGSSCGIIDDPDAQQTLPK